MDEKIEDLILKQKQRTGKKPVITPEEEEKFGEMEYDSLYNRICNQANLTPRTGAPIVEGINTEDDRVIVMFDHRHGFSLEELGYIAPEGVYRPRPRQRVYDIFQ